MIRNQFYDSLKNSFYGEKSSVLQDFETMIKGTMPVFGSLETTISEDEKEGKTITFIDNDTADITFNTKESLLSDIDINMSTTLMTLTLDKNDIIQTVSHNIGGFFTPANEDNAYLLANLIGKKVIF